ncbi:hypothetical protein DL93DRAFT_748471 [Clavulina sp. PMI_390]|nr:hypothetical protein DL93DRAFT_748471 [Clavulina sp. PMI_390]
MYPLSSSSWTARSFGALLFAGTALHGVTAQNSTDSSGPIDPNTSTTDGGTLSITAQSSTTTSNTDTQIPPPLNPTSSSGTTTVSASATSSSGPSSGGSHSHGGAIAGGVIGGLVVLGICIGLAFLYYRRKGSYYRGRTGRDGPAVPPSPRLRTTWLGKETDGASAAAGAGSVFTRHGKGQRLGSVDGKTATLDGHGRQRSVTATSDDAHELSGAAAFAAGRAAGSSSSAAMGRNRSSRSSLGPAAPNGRGAYDLSVFNSHSNVNGNGTSPSRQPTDPFASDPSLNGGGVATTANTSAGSSELTRAQSTTRPTRKPAPKYDESMDAPSPVSPTSPRHSSKPPVSGGPVRSRTYSNSSSLRAQAAANSANGHGNEGSSRSSLDVPAPELSHKSSAGTLGGAFKFAGEKEGVTHYLIPDPPSASME